MVYSIMDVDKYIKYVISILILIYLIMMIGTNKYVSDESPDQLTAHNARAIVISCMDFRLIDDKVYLMDKLGYTNNYDEIILAGASLGYNQKVYDSWKKTVDDHIQLAQKLHNINQIIVVDHMSCGAYKLLYNKPNLTRDDEIKLHKENFIKFRKLMKDKYPKLEVLTYLMELDGTILCGLEY